MSFYLDKFIVQLILTLFYLSSCCIVETAYKDPSQGQNNQSQSNHSPTKSSDHCHQLFRSLSNDGVIESWSQNCLVALYFVPHIIVNKGLNYWSKLIHCHCATSVGDQFIKKCNPTIKFNMVLTEDHVWKKIVLGLHLKGISKENTEHRHGSSHAGRYQKTKDNEERIKLVSEAKLKY